MRPHYITPESLSTFIKNALAEDVGDGDHTSLASIPAEAKNKARLIVKGEGVLAGVELAGLIFNQVDPTLEFKKHISDGTKVKNGEIAFEVSGSARAILTSERLVLNCMQRMSGIATYTSQLVTLLAGTTTRLLDTRKTTPNFRMMEKWAVVIGGGVNHRYGLFDMILLKDNHVDYAGGISNAIKNTHEYLKKTGKDLKIEIETRNLKEVDEVLICGGVHRIMLDNMDNETMKKAVSMIAGKYEVEASGGVTEKTIRGIAETGVDFISVGALTHSAGSMDMSLKAF